ncbi:MAG: alanine--tRNA ligase [Deltaproteobacteria bacterium]|nr:alanine--tRNA ligase [Deltaproteobacteria bacterium]
MKSSSQIRESFLSFFESRGHRRVKSSGLIPQGDATLLFTNAGMVPFKDFFTGAVRSDFSRATTSQKCMRVSGKHNDLENVGRTPRHHTFFEMLGNFSFGDYFKAEAIDFAWEFLTKTVALPKERLWITVFREDDEAEALWKARANVSADRIVRLGEADNFWAMGDTGPCGPCSEIHIDQGEAAGCGRPSCTFGCECGRYMELWNLVFMQFERDAKGAMTKLPKPSIDTGAGLERLAGVLQGTTSNYGSDLFGGLIETASALAKKAYGKNDEDDVSMRVIADHARATAFLVADGVLPQNEGRGYVLRRVMRRAIRHGERLGLKDLFFHAVCGRVVDEMRSAYPELDGARALIDKVARQEEEGFRRTLASGCALLQQEIAKGGKAIAGAVAFKLYDTFGFPLDLTEVIAGEAGMAVDRAGFDAHMEEQRGRSTFKGEANAVAVGGAWKSATSPSGSRFLGYEATKVRARVLDAIESNGRVEFTCDQTPFYAESGGQIGDAGEARGARGVLRVSDTKRVGERIVHIGVGSVAAGDDVELIVDEARRDAIRRNHSATHLAHWALRSVLGDHVKQAGSLVAPDRLRFDFSHFQPLTSDEIARVEDLVNARVVANFEVGTRVSTYDAAVKDGVIAFFGEKYGNEVRVVQVSPESRELCGGTHCRRSGDIGFFKIVSEEGIAAGVRRIEAVTGMGAVAFVRGLETTLKRAAGELKSAPAEIVERVGKLREREAKLVKEIEELTRKMAGGQARDLVADAVDAGGVRVIATRAEIADPKGMRDFADGLKERLKSGVIVLGAVNDGKAVLLAAVTPDLVGRVHAGKLMGELCAIVGGRGGGKPDMAQGGGSDVAALDAALASVAEKVRKAVGA